MGKHLFLILSALVFSCASSVSVAKGKPKIVLQLSPSSDLPTDSGNLTLVLMASSRNPVPVRINFWIRVRFVLQDLDGKTLKWTDFGSDGLRTPPPPEAIPSLAESGTASLPITVIPKTMEKNGVTARSILVATKWGMRGIRTSLPYGDLYLRVTLQGNRGMKSSGFVYDQIVRGIGKEGYSQMYEDFLESNWVRLHWSDTGPMTVSVVGGAAGIRDTRKRDRK